MAKGAKGREGASERGVVVVLLPLAISIIKGDGGEEGKKGQRKGKGSEGGLGVGGQREGE